jgi:two-component system nitrate/nitrite sensor histidine kinase NarX
MIIRKEVVGIQSTPTRHLKKAMTSRNSLVNRIATAVSAVVLTAIVSMGVTLGVSQSIAGNATAINLAGTLRMGAYQLLAQVARLQDQNTADGRHVLNQMISRYNQRLVHADIIQSLPLTTDHPLAQRYRDVVSQWNSSVGPMLAQHRPGDSLTGSMINTTQSYVDNVDVLVSMLENRTEARISLLHLMQVISLVFAILIVLALFLDLKNRVLRPLRKLVSIAESVSKQDFSRKAELGGSDELAQLGSAFDQMTSELALTYYELESKVQAKTEELEKSHAALELLHSSSRTLFANHNLCDGAVPMLQQLEQMLGIGPINLYLHDKASAEPVQAVTTATTVRPFYCHDHSCNACLVTEEEHDELPLPGNDGRRLLLPIRTPGQLLGTLEVWYPASQDLSRTARRLLETLSDQLATAIFLERQITEEQQRTLIEERTVIARELHDSLAQSLSYLKIQVTRLRRMNMDGPQKTGYNAVLDELSTGLSSAYRQLRELLATFRLKLDTPDLGAALRQTVHEFSGRMAKPVNLAYKLPAQTLSPNEEIHTLQVVREALANAVKHSKAEAVWVNVSFESPQVKAKIRDNGRGLPDSGQPERHYGMIIMQERARSLGGQLTVANHPLGGVEVSLRFIPHARNQIPVKPANIPRIADSN